MKHTLIVHHKKIIIMAAANLFFKFLSVTIFCFISVFSLAQQKDADGYDIFVMEDEGKSTTMKKYYLCLLKSGPNRDQPKEEAEKIQAGHMAHIKKMAAENKLCIAGPTESKSDLIGIFIFNVKSAEEAEALAAQDPAVKAGRLLAEIVPWWAAKGSILF
ncbi:MAG: hypothetical protein IPI60_02375 [Saprospiraceae bacterium]|nr:hypothetical protein [Saprospiraceae bacterium]